MLAKDLCNFLPLQSTVSPPFLSLTNNVNCLDCRKDVRLPLQLQRAMAAEAEATRDARAKVLNQSGTPTNFQSYLF